MTKKKINIDDVNAWSNLDWNEPVVPDVLKKTDAVINVARANRIRTQSPEHRKRMSEIQKGKRKGPQSELTKERNRQSNLGRVISESTRQKLSENAKKQMNDPKAKLNNSKQAKERLSIPSNNPNYKGFIYSKNVETGEIKSYDGPKDFIGTGYNYFTVLKRIKTGKIHKGHVWYRESN